MKSNTLNSNQKENLFEEKKSFSGKLVEVALMVLLATALFGLFFISF